MVIGKLIFGDVQCKVDAGEFKRRAAIRRKTVDGIIGYYVVYVPSEDWPRLGLIRRCWPNWLQHHPQSVLDDCAIQLQEMRTE